MKRFGLFLATIVAVALLVRTVDSGPRYNRAGVRDLVSSWEPTIFPPSVRVNIPIDINGDYSDWKFVRAPTFLDLTTSVSADNNILHPGVVYVPHGFADYNYWLVGSPFTGASTIVECPEIFYSATGAIDDWTAIKSNPITADPAGATHLSDNTLFYETNGNGAPTLHCIYRWSDASTEDRLKHKSSVDGQTWSSETTLITGGSYGELVSPSIANVNGTYWMWYVNTYASPNKLVYRTSTSLTSGWSSATDCTLNGAQGGDVIWHNSVQRVGDAFVLLGTFHSNYDAYVGTSVDGITFDCEKIYDTSGNTTTSWDSNFVYGMSGIWNPSQGSMDVFYGGYDGTIYHIGVGKLLRRRDYNLQPLNKMLEILGDCRGFWPFLASNDVTMQDYSLSDHDLTASKDVGTWDTAPVLRSPVHILSFDGTDEEFDTPDHADFEFGDGSDDSPFTVSAWVYITDTAARRTIIAKSDEDTDVELRGWVFEINASDKLVLRLHDESTNSYMDTVSNAAPSAATWHFVTGTYAGSAEAVTELNLYVDGVLVASTDHDDQGGTYDAMEDLATKVTVGFMLGVDGTPTPSYFFNGKMAMPSLSAGERSAANEWLLYRNGKEVLGLK